MTITKYTRPHQTKRPSGWERDYHLTINTSVCFKCRSHNNGHVCQFCGGDMVNLGFCPKIPKKNDKRGWIKLAQVYYRYITPKAVLEDIERRWKAKCQSPNSILFNDEPIKHRPIRMKGRRWSKYH